ncbi:MAG: DUF932 domain-containing protein [Paludibacter sp.]
MARNTNINKILFPVECKPIYLENQNNPIHGFKAVTGKFDNNSEVIFSIVSDNYQLITNKEAYEMGKEIHGRLFPNATSDSFEVFNVITPKTNGSCHIDIIDKNYKLNLWAQEVYVPFVRIQNSYNRTLPLKFQIGFCRKLCNNGAIFEKNLVSISIAHTKQLYRNTDFLNVNVNHLKKFENDFIKKTKRSNEIEIARKYFLPLAAKVLNQNFNLAEKDEKKRILIEQKLNEFTFVIENYTDKYIQIEQMGESAYAFFNVITDYASNVEHLQVRSTNEMQVRCGTWLNLIGEQVSNPKFSWEEEVEDYNYLNGIKKLI